MPPARFTSRESAFLLEYLPQWVALGDKKKKKKRGESKRVEAHEQEGDERPQHMRSRAVLIRQVSESFFSSFPERDPKQQPESVNLFSEEVLEDFLEVGVDASYQTY